MKELTQGGFLISKIHQLSGRIFSKKLKDNHININPAQGRILFALWQEDQISIQNLSKRTALGKSTLTRMLDRMQDAGFIYREYPDNDRRKVLICLTEENKKMKASYEALSLEMTDIFYKGFSKSEIIQFETYLNRILENLIACEINQ